MISVINAYIEIYRNLLCTNSLDELNIFRQYKRFIFKFAPRYICLKVLLKYGCYIMKTKW